MHVWNLIHIVSPAAESYGLQGKQRGTFQVQVQGPVDLAGMELRIAGKMVCGQSARRIVF